MTTGDTRQRELHPRQHRQEEQHQHDIDEQTERSDAAECAVHKAHEQHDQEDADRTGDEAERQRLFAQRGGDRLAFSERQLHVERARHDLIGQSLRRFERKAAADDRLPVGDGRLDVRRGNGLRVFALHFGND